VTTRRASIAAWWLFLLGACSDTDGHALPRDGGRGNVDAAYVEHELDAGRALDAGKLVLAPLVDMESWRAYDAAIDPLRDHQPSMIQCDARSFYEELGALEVDTARCNYLLAFTPALRRVPAGSEVHVSLLHFDLQAATPAEVHVALLFGDSVEWETTIPIPTRAGEEVAVFRSKQALEFQDPVRLHLHNHGGNTYMLGALEVAEGR
jgi:hypothetical protein